MKPICRNKGPLGSQPRSLCQICQLPGSRRRGSLPADALAPPIASLAQEARSPVGSRHTAGRTKNKVHCRLERHLLKSHLCPKRAEVTSSKGPHVRWAAHPCARSPPAHIPSYSQCREATLRLPKKMSPSWPHTPSATCCTASNEARGSPGSPMPDKARPGQPSKNQSRGTGPGWRQLRGR